MTTDIRTGIKTKDEYIDAASIGYIPSILALPKVQRFTLDINKVTFREFSVENDSVVPSDLLPEATEINAIKISQKSHSFMSYGQGNTLRQDLRMQGTVNIQGFHDDILRQYSIKFDKKAYVGEGGNNGLIVSVDENYITKASKEIPAISGDGFNQLLEAKKIATSLNLDVNNYTASSDITVYFYGIALLEFLGNITPGQENDVRFHIEQAFRGKNVNFVEISELALPASLGLGNGIIVASSDQTLIEHSGLPEIQSTGVNEEHQYYWSNYLLGSVQIRPELKGAVIKQPITFA